MMFKLANEVAKIMAKIKHLNRNNEFLLRRFVFIYAGILPRVIIYYIYLNN